jgi:hypothetical protein
MNSSQLKRILHKEMTRKDFLSFTALGIASLFGAFGVIAELLSHAATPFATEEAEKGSKTGVATTVISATASGGEAVQFGGLNSFGLGIAIGSDQQISQATDSGASIFATIKAAGFTSIRTDAFYTPTHIVDNDTTIRAALKEGLDVLITIDGYHANDTTLAEYTSFASAVVSTYSILGIHHYEILNEPNSSKNWDSNNNYVNPTAYAALLKATYTVVKAADSKAMVLIGGFGTFTPIDGAFVGNGNYLGSLTPRTWITLVYEALGGTSSGAFDIMNVHPYTAPANPEASSGLWGSCFAPTNSVRAIMTTNGDSTKPMWITEYGANTGTGTGGTTLLSGQVTFAQQVTEYQDALTLCRGYSYLDFFYCFNWQDDSDGNFGLNTASFIAKPALATVQSFMGEV